jgi:hypothetical protein
MNSPDSDIRWKQGFFNFKKKHLLLFIGKGSLLMFKCYCIETEF